MQTKIELEKGKMSEREVRDAIERSAAHARQRDEQRGKRTQTDDGYRREMEKCANEDNRKGKI